MQDNIISALLNFCIEIFELRQNEVSSLVYKYPH